MSTKYVKMLWVALLLAIVVSFTPPASSTSVVLAETCSSTGSGCLPH